MFSFGVVLWELCTLQKPWEGMNPMQVVGAVGYQGARLQIPEEIDSTIAAMIQACWSRYCYPLQSHSIDCIRFWNGGVPGIKARQLVLSGAHAYV